MDWIDLKDLKASNPVELAEYALANELEEEPAFKAMENVCKMIFLEAASNLKLTPTNGQTKAAHHLGIGKSGEEKFFDALHQNIIISHFL